MDDALVVYCGEQLIIFTTPWLPFSHHSTYLTTTVTERMLHRIRTTEWTRKKNMATLLKEKDNGEPHMATPAPWTVAQRYTHNLWCNMTKLTQTDPH